MRRARKSINQINVVPYIDVMLVLLVIFMVTAPLVTPAQVELPTMQRTSKEPITPIEIIIKADGATTLRDRDKGLEGPKSEDEIVRHVKTRQAEKPDQPVPVIIAADKNVKYEVVLKVMDALQKNQIQKVGLSVKPAPAK